MNVLMKYMLTLKQNLRKLGCALPIVLLLDAAPVHLSQRILQFAGDNSIQLAYIPARLTWLLQPLDTHAFANLKRRIRKQHADMCIASPTGAVSRDSTIRQQHRAIVEELSEKTWGSAMERVGATGVLNNLRPNIATLIAGQDLAARYPSSDDLAALLNITTARAQNPSSIAPRTPTARNTPNSQHRYRTQQRWTRDSPGNALTQPEHPTRGAAPVAAGYAERSGDPAHAGNPCAAITTAASATTTGQLARQHRSEQRCRRRQYHHRLNIPRARLPAEPRPAT